MFENGLVLSSPGRVLFQINGFEIYTYGVIIAFAILCGVMASGYIADKSGKFPKGTFVDLSPFMIISGIFGARAWYCFVNFKEFVFSPLNVFNIRAGGISIHGALLAGFITLIFYAKKHKLNLISLCDYAVPGLALGQAVGRWGNFFNNEAFGVPYDGFLKLYIPPFARPYQFAEYDYFHPAFLYESIGDFILFGLILFVLNKFAPKYSGITTLIYLAGYSALRFLIELIRVDSNVFIFNIKFPAFVSLIIFTGAVASLTFCLTKRYK